MLMSLTPINEKWSVRGIGVAVSVRQSRLVFFFLIFSFNATPNFCSSSITSNPKSLNSYLSFKAVCVPIKISMSPFNLKLIEDY